MQSYRQILHVISINNDGKTEPVHTCETKQQRCVLAILFLFYFNCVGTITVSVSAERTLQLQVLTQVFNFTIASRQHINIYSTQYIYGVYRAPATGARSPRIAYRQSLWLADMWHATGLPRAPVAGSPVGVKNQNGVDVQASSNLAIGLLFFGTRSLIKG